MTPPPFCAIIQLSVKIDRLVENEDRYMELIQSAPLFWLGFFASMAACVVAFIAASVR